MIQGTEREQSFRSYKHSAMAQVTFQLIEGLERGRVFSDLSTPVSIGREDENTIQLNDERVSRFHAKVQDDSGRVILTDLDSTNGTRVNGHPVQMRVLQVGDQVAIGRCLIIYGSRHQIAERFGTGLGLPGDGGISDPAGQTIAAPSDQALDPEIAASLPGGADAPDHQPELFPGGPPIPPGKLRPAQRAQVSDFVSYVHEQIRRVLQSGRESNEDDPDAPMQLDRPTWQRLLQLEMDLAIYLRKLAEPDN
ncbi:MAG: FHA domain-containing protein [Planctomycetaceae bacterium]